MSGWITRNRWWVKHTTKQPGINWSYPTLWPIVLISLLLHAAPCMFNVHNVCSFRISDKTLSQKIFRDSFPHIGHELTSLCTRCWRENRALRLKITEARKHRHPFGFHWGSATFGFDTSTRTWNCSDLVNNRDTSHNKCGGATLFLASMAH